MKKASGMDCAIADRDAEIAMIMAMGSATAKEASKALVDENDGTVDRAMACLYDTKLQCNTCSSNAQPFCLQRTVVNDDDGISKPPTKSHSSPAPQDYTKATEGTGK